MPDMEVLSDYEIQRRANIAKNAEVLSSLGLGGGGLVPHVEPLPRIKRPKRPPPPPTEPTRKSARAAGAKAPIYYVSHETAGGQITLGGDDVEQAKAWMRERSFGGEKKVTRRSPLDAFKSGALDDGVGSMPETDDDLLIGEKEAYEALRAAKNAKAQELEIQVCGTKESRGGGGVSACPSVSACPPSRA